MSEKSILGVHPSYLEGKPWEKFGMTQYDYEFDCLQGYPPELYRHITIRAGIVLGVLSAFGLIIILIMIMFLCQLWITWV